MLIQGLSSQVTSRAQGALVQSGTREIRGLISCGVICGCSNWRLYGSVRSIVPRGCLAAGAGEGMSSGTWSVPAVNAGCFRQGIIRKLAGWKTWAVMAANWKIPQQWCVWTFMILTRQSGHSPGPLPKLANPCTKALWVSIDPIFSWPCRLDLGPGSAM